MNKKNLTAKEKLFSALYLSLGNPLDAAAAAGYEHPYKNGLLLLQRDDIQDYIESLDRKNNRTLALRVRSGYERLAFGNVSDAVRLLFSADPLSENLHQSDFFNIAEIKRLKDGAMEIKFFDRIKALEKLQFSVSEQQHSASDFYNALVGSIKSPDDGGDNDSF